MAKRIKKKDRNVTPIAWSWPAFCLGPIWYLRYGMWKPAALMILIIVMGDKIMLIPVALYAALRFEEDLVEFKKARKRAKTSK